jgi:NAD(P)H-hydrate epimerase
VIAGPDRRTALNPTSGPLSRQRGTGDIAHRIVVGLVAQGVPAFEAATLGAWLHGFAGDRLTARRGCSGVLASEVAAELPEACEALREQGGVAEQCGVALPFP